MKENLARIIPGGRIQKTKNEIKAKPLVWISNLLRQHKEDQDELTQKKIDFLVKQAYDYYLTLIINQIIENQELDFHPALYEAGIIINLKAQSLAKEAVLFVAKQGQKRINECYTKRIKQLKDSGIKA